MSVWGSIIIDRSTIVCLASRRLLDRRLELLYLKLVLCLHVSHLFLEFLLLLPVFKFEVSHVSLKARYDLSLVECNLLRHLLDITCTLHVLKFQVFHLLLQVFNIVFTVFYLLAKLFQLSHMQSLLLFGGINGELSLMLKLSNLLF